MDEEKEQQKHQNGAIKNVGNKLKEGAKKQAKNAMKEVFKKIIKLLAPILIKILIIIIIAVVIIEAISSILGLNKSTNSKSSTQEAISYSYVDSEDEEETKTGYRINVSPDIENRRYKIEYQFIEDDGTEVSEQKALDDIKQKLEENNLDITLFTDSELKIIAVLVHKGLDLADYSEEQLKCLPLFLKAEIAGQNLDLRKRDEIGKQIDEQELEKILEGDYVYGTIEVTRTAVKSEPEYLEYIELGDEDTPRTFKYILNQEGDAAKKALEYFSIDEKGNLLIAKSGTITTVTNIGITDENGNALTEEQMANIPQENIPEQNNNTSKSVYMGQPINYKPNIKKYVLRYGLLSDLLITTQNASFCGELSRLAFNSKVVIDLKEETKDTTATTNTTYTQTRLISKYAKYHFEKDTSKTNTTEENIKTGTGAPTQTSVGYGWDSSKSHTTTPNGRITTYTWTNSSKNYKLVVSVSASGNVSWTLSELVQTETTETNLFGGNENQPNDGEFIKKGNIDEHDYTRMEKWTYKTTVTTKTHSTTYKIEISEIDSWFLKYRKEYLEPAEPEPKEASSIGESQGEYEELEKTYTEDQDTINADEDVTQFKTKKEQSQGAGTKCVVSRLTYGGVYKEDAVTQYSSTTIETKFGEENADTTEVQLKNVKYIDGVPEFTATITDENGNEKDEIGFLYIYDKYTREGEDLFLEQDAEKLLFEMLEKDSSTVEYSDTLKYLLYIYDGVDRGVTELDLSIFKPEEFKSTRTTGSAIIEWLRSYEFNPLRELRNGKITLEQFKSQPVQPDTVRINEDGKYEYNPYELNVGSDHSLNYSYGIRVYDLETGKYGNEGAFSQEGVNLQEVITRFRSTGDGWLDADLVDRVQVIIVNEQRERIKEAYDLKGVNLESYEIDALIAMAYAYGEAGAGVKKSENIELVRNYKNGTLTKEGLITNFKGTRGHPFQHKGRGTEFQLMFFDGRYILSTGEEIFPEDFFEGGSLVEAAYYVADHYLNSGVDVHYAGASNPDATNNGIIVASGLQNSWDLPIEQPDKYGIVCATFVSLSIWKAGLIDEETINRYNIHYCDAGGIETMLTDAGWEKITNFDDLQEGDVVIIKGHTFICDEGGKTIDQNYCTITSKNQDKRKILGDLNTNYNRTRFKEGFRYNGS